MSEAIAVVNKAQAIERLRTSLESIVTLRGTWIDGKRAELERAVAANRELRAAGASETKLRYSRHRVNMLRKVVSALEAGFVPIPRFDASSLDVDFEELPLAAISALADAKATELFDEVKIVRGAEAIGGQGRRRYRTQRDPLLIGIVRMPSVTVSRDNNQWPSQRVLPAREEHFLLAWWRPEDECDEDMW